MKSLTKRSASQYAASELILCNLNMQVQKLNFAPNTVITYPFPISQQTTINGSPNTSLHSCVLIGEKTANRSGKVKFKATAADNRNSEKLRKPLIHSC